ncbi:hypothetical protein RAB80_006957 [Fusarium oxysporum f. sp. vasinfectum]|nr:hypothetical protein RAB80_006957 [Fusarium oxysporum f. sp. vasinfectum]
MASMPSATRPQDDGPSVASTATTDEQTVNLQVLSPSVGVNRPLLFPNLAANTTIKQLKDKIRQALPLRPADDHQRLIHRGHALVREADTLVDIFGADAIRTSEQQTIHLVLRDMTDSPSSTPNAPSAPPSLAAPVPAPAPARGPSPTASAPPTHPPRPQPQQPQQPHGQPFGYQMPPGWRNSMPPTSNPFPQPRMPSPSPSHTPEQAAAFQHQHQNMTQWLNSIQREAMARALNQNQRTRAQMGMRGVGDPNNPGNTGGNNSGRASPAPGHTVYREHVGPNGSTYQFETVIRTVVPGQQGNGGASGSMSPADVQNLFRNADINQATSAMASAMQRSASSTSLHNRHQHGMTAPMWPMSQPMTGSGRGTPDLSLNRLSTTAAPGSSQTRQGPEVYILSSPEGPRALLLNNTSSETYITPRLRTQTSLPHLRQAAALSSAALDAQRRPLNLQPPQPFQQQAQNLAPQQQPAYPAQAQGQNQAQEPDPAAIMAPLMHRGNPPMAALPPLLMQLWPQIWLLFRLVLFVWFFTSPNASWSRWFTIIVIAVLIFLLSTGIFNGVPDHVWQPLGRHLENLIPAEPRRRQAIAGEDQQNQQPRQNPDPTEMARRLVAQHQGPETAAAAAAAQNEESHENQDQAENLVESDAGVFTSLIENLGVKDVQFEELLTLDPSELLSLQPVYGVIFLFKYPTDQPYATPEGPRDGSFDNAASENIFFAAQTIQNACATQALLSVLLNKTNDVEIGEKLGEFREFTMVLPPEFRGEALSNSDLIREVHNSFARSSPFADETDKTGAEAEDAFHFIAYTPINGTLYELDGLQPAPISHGACSSDDFATKVVDVLQRRIARYDTTEIRFNLLAMCRDLRQRARDFGDEELLAREERKRRDWMFENALRRHNFVGFAGEVMKGVVRSKISEGGDAAYEKWVKESLERRKNAEQAMRA